MMTIQLEDLERAATISALTGVPIAEAARDLAEIREAVEASKGVWTSDEDGRLIPPPGWRVGIDGEDE